MSRNRREGRYLGRLNGKHKRTLYDARTLAYKHWAKRMKARGEDISF